MLPRPGHGSCLPSNPDHSQCDVFVIAVDGSRETKAVDHPAHDVVMAWAPDGRLLFASDRTGVVGLWAVPVLDGRPQSGPTLLKPDIGTVLSQGLTSAGALYTVKAASSESLQVAPIDLGAGRLTGPALLENFRSGRPDWTRDGKLLATSGPEPATFRQSWCEPSRPARPASSAPRSSTSTSQNGSRMDAH